MASNQSASQDTFFSQSAEPDDRDGKPDRQWFWPRYRVFNDVASQIVDQLLAITGLRDKKANQIILASFLQAAQWFFDHPKAPAIDQQFGAILLLAKFVAALMSRKTLLRS